MHGSELRLIFVGSHQESSSVQPRLCAMRTLGLLGMLFVFILLSAARADSSPLIVKAVDRTGAAFPNVLVIVKSLEGKGEIFRALTDAAGSIPRRDLPGGLYRVIATCPYGICETRVQEFYVKDVPVKLKLTVDVMPTHGEGDVVEVGLSRQLKVLITDGEGQPARFASLLVRDAGAEHERWYKTDSSGSATIELPEESVTVVVLYGGNLDSKTFSQAATDELRAKGAPLTIHLGARQGAGSGVGGAK